MLDLATDLSAIDDEAFQEEKVERKMLFFKIIQLKVNEFTQFNNY